MHNPPPITVALRRVTLWHLGVLFHCIGISSYGEVAWKILVFHHEWVSVKAVVRLVFWARIDPRSSY